MGTTLTGTTPQDTYDSLIKVTDNGPLSGTAKYLSDGLGNDSKLALSTSQVGVGTTSLSAWAFDAFQVEGASIWSSGNDLGLNSNSYYDGSNYVYRASSAAARIYMDTDGSAFFANAASGTAGNPITFNTRLQITSAGNVGIGTSSPDTLLTLGSTARTDNTAGIKIFRGGGTASYATYGFSGNAVINSVGGDLVIQRESSEVARFTTAGLCFNGDFAAANALDDYEEGTFSPTVIGTTSAGTANYYQQFGRYTKIGRTVNFQLFIAYDTGTGTGNLRISGLPFTATSTNVNNALAIGYFDVVSLTAAHVATSWIENGTTELGIYQYPVGGGAAAVVPYDAAANISISGTYIV